jgi:hypothetical protein
MLRPGRFLLAAVAAFATAGPNASCAETYPPFADRQIDAALRAAGGVQGGELMPLVREIYEARLGDPQNDTAFADRCGEGGGCVYSRRATAELIRRRWADPEFAPGGEPGEQARAEGGFETVNLMLDLPGRTRPGEWVLATAHYDAWFGGANDNATGVAVTLAAARALARASLDRSVRLVLFDGEELGMVGSGRYVEEYGVENVVMVLNADMIAHRGDEGGALTGQPRSVEYILQADGRSAAAAHQVADLGRRLPRPVSQRPLVFPGDGVSLVGVLTGVDLSDHAPFWLAGAPALFPFPAGDKPGWYHTARDTPDEVDADRLERMAALWAAAIAAFATLAP